MQLLIVEDHASVARFLKQAVEEAGYKAMAVADGTRALAVARSQKFDLILLDVMLPGLDGLEVCRALRNAGIGVPILILTARDTLEDKISGLDAGADDYIVKPFQVAELLARMRALLRRGNVIPAVLVVDDLILDPARRHAERGGKTIALSATEYTLLKVLMSNAGQVMRRSDLLDHVWQYDFQGNDNVLDVYISYLRNKIDKGRARPLIHTVRGVGFRLAVNKNS
jgi:DNA-binding response OmpR family regulator